MDFRCKITQKSTIMQILFQKTFFLRTQFCKKNYSSMEETAKNKEIHRDDDAIDG